MDAVIISAGSALVGVVIGAIVNPLSTAKWSASAKRRDLMREVYAVGMASVTSIGTIRTSDDLDEARSRILTAQMQIQLAGSGPASKAFDAYSVYATDLLDDIAVEAKKTRIFISVEKRASSVFSATQRTTLQSLHKDFVERARRDLGMERMGKRRWWRR